MDFKRKMKLSDIEENIFFTYTADKFILIEMIDSNKEPFYIIFNDKWPEHDVQKIHINQNGENIRDILRNYGSFFAKLLVIFKAAIEKITKTLTVDYVVYVNEEIVVSNNRYRIKITRNLNAIPSNNTTLQ